MYLELRRTDKPLGIFNQTQNDAFGRARKGTICDCKHTR